MTTFFRKYSTPILFFLLLTFLVFTWLFPSDGLMLGVIFLLFSLVTASATVLEKHKEAYRQGKIRRIIFIRNAVLEVTGILLAMALAGLLGRYVVGMTTQQINNDLIRFTAGIIIGLLVGIGVGVFMRQAKDRFAKSFS